MINFKNEHMEFVEMLSQQAIEVGPLEHDMLTKIVFQQLNAFKSTHV